MSSPISPIQGPQPTGSAPAARGARRGAGADFPGAIAVHRAPVALDTIPSSPPAEVLDQIAAASEAYERLSAQGLELRFAHDPQSARASVELRDRAGNFLRSVPVSEALEIATGEPPS